MVILKNIHCRATQRHRKNQIWGARDDSNIWQDQPNNVAAVLIKYYTDLFSSSYKEPYSASLDHIPHVITEEMNLALIRAFSEAELSLALKQMVPLKVPGPNGTIVLSTLLGSG